MGLDMYINGSRWVDRDQSEAIADVFPELASFKDTGYSTVREIAAELGYWRKANHIHKWFVDNVQGGYDNCDSYPLSREQLERLKADCLRVLADPSLASEVLPRASGFFFGASDYDEHYLRDLSDTVDIIDRCLSLGKQWDFTYRSSW